MTGFSFCPSLVLDMVAFCAPHVQSNHDTPRTSYEIIRFDVMVLVSQIMVYPHHPPKVFALSSLGDVPRSTQERFETPAPRGDFGSAVRPSLGKSCFKSWKERTFDIFFDHFWAQMISMLLIC